MATISRFPGKDKDNDNMDFSEKLHLHKLKSFVAVLVCVAIFTIYNYASVVIDI